MLVEAAAGVVREEPDVTFVLVGDGPARSSLEANVRAEDLESNFRFTGWRTDVPKILKTFDLFVSTSIFEALGNALVEAQLAKVPVIAPAVDGISEVVRDGMTGVLLEPTEPVDRFWTDAASRPPRGVVRKGAIVQAKALSPESLTRAILEMLDRPHRADRLVQNAYEHARKVFSVEKYANELNGVYFELARRKGIV